MSAQWSCESCSLSAPGVVRVQQGCLAGWESPCDKSSEGPLASPPVTPHPFLSNHTTSVFFLEHTRHPPAPLKPLHLLSFPSQMLFLQTGTQHTFLPPLGLCVHVIISEEALPDHTVQTSNSCTPALLRCPFCIIFLHLP